MTISHIINNIIDKALQPTSFEEDLAKTIVKMVNNIHHTSHDLYELLPSMKELMDAAAAGITGLPIQVIDDIDDQQLPQEIFEKQTSEIGKASDFTNTPDTI